MLVNLLTNAHEYCPAGASIEVDGAGSDGEVEIAVSDNGPGMPEEQLDTSSSASPAATPG